MPAGPYNPALPVTGTDITTTGFGFPVVRAIRWWNGVPLAGDTERPQANIYQTTLQSIPNATATAILFDTENLDTANGHSTTTNTSRWTCPAGLTGWFNVGCHVSVQTNATGYRQASTHTNGIGNPAQTMACVNGVNGNNTNLQLFGKHFLAAGDFIEVALVQTSGGALNTGSPGCYMTVEMCRTQ